MTDGSVSLGGASLVRVDFAHTLREHLVVCGWVVGLASHVARAEISYGDLTIDLMSLGVPVPRPDVTQHFASLREVEGDQHGFYIAVALPVAGIRPGYLRLSVSSSLSQSSESVWPVTSGERGAVKLALQHRTTLEWLLRNLSATDADPLRELVPGFEELPKSAISAPSPGLDLLVRVEFCLRLGTRFLVLHGWFDERDAPLTAASLTLGDAVVDCFSDMTFARRTGETAHTFRGETRKLGFTWVGLAPPAVGGGYKAIDAVFEFRAGDRYGRTRRILTSDAAQELERALDSLEPDGAVDLLGRIAELVEKSAGAFQDGWLADLQRVAIERLPAALENHCPRVNLHCDSVVPVADQGVYITGWFSAEEDAVQKVECHSGTKSLRMDDRWIRQSRQDVTTHLAAQGFGDADAEHAYLCHVPLVDCGVPYYLSVTFSSGTVRRIRLPSFSKSSSTIHSVRALLSSFAPSHRSLRSVLQHHVAPAVATMWSHRRRPSIRPTVGRFGPVVAKPAVSVIVPLYARHDLADYQLAAFADDPDFQTLELIYFVDDPAIYDGFRAKCEDSYEIYRVPFTLAFAGTNLGFAGANNCAARLATGRHLLLLNSDVLPKSSGWISEMLALYATLQSPGFLGAKLLYEDGSVQHAGIKFRRHAPWHDLWINDHPNKGQTGVGLHGLRKVDAVTAACALVDTQLYCDLGGLSEDYIIGDFEDSDFCLRAAAAGRFHWVSLDTELYHLERQSLARVGDAQWRTNLTLFNCWQHQLRWGEQLETHPQ